MSLLEIIWPTGNNNTDKYLVLIRLLETTGGDCTPTEITAGR